MRKKQKSLTMKTVVNYCPCCIDTKIPEKTSHSIIVAQECGKHNKHKEAMFVKTGNSVMVLESFSGRFKKIMEPAILNSNRCF